jgi:hypothetical protein
MSGTVNLTAGGMKKSGTASLTANADGSGNASFSFADGSSRTEAYSGYGVAPRCQWAGADGVQHAIDPYNCALVGPWFLPQMSLLSPNSQPNLGYAANGSTLGIYRASTLFPLPAQTIETISLNTLQVDPVTYLVTTASFTEYSDRTPASTASGTVTFGSYATYKNVAIPTSITRQINSSTYLSLTITSAAIQN